MSDIAIKTRKKLIEVALPLDAINTASAREKSIRHGHPSTLHLWWARRPLAAARAVIFSQMVDDPGEYTDTLLQVDETRKAAEQELKKRRKLWETLPDDADREAEPTLEGCAADIERERLFRIIEDLVKWENRTNEFVLDKARAEIWQSWRRACADNAGHPRASELFDRNKLPAFHDPFAGGGALPLEAQRLGLEAHASDLNPVAVLINKAMIEIPPKFANRPPVNPEADTHRAWKGAEGLADDVRYYGKWMRDEAEKRIGHMYPKVKVTAEMAVERPDLKPYVDRELTVIAWLWARTVKSPNPAFRDIDVPLVSNFLLSAKSDNAAWVEPIVSNDSYRFVVRVGRKAPAEAKSGTKSGRGSNFRCLMSDSPVTGDYIKAEGSAGRMGSRLLAIVVEGDSRRLYLPPLDEHQAIAKRAVPDWSPVGDIPQRLSGGTCVPYGFAQWADLFTPRQLQALDCFSALVAEAREKVDDDAIQSGCADDITSLDEGGTGARAISDAISVYLAAVVSKQTVFLVTQARWRAGEGKSAPAFGRQGFPMVWDYVEINPFAGAGGDFFGIVQGAEKTILALPATPEGKSHQAEATMQTISRDRVVSSDPPYYDNIFYADLSDYFYVWLRRNLRDQLPELFTTVAVPKAEELVATAYRHGGAEAAEAFFLAGMTKAMERLASQAHASFPTTIYYAFKQSETDEADGTTSTGWETFLAAVVNSGFGVSGTWPMRTENATRLVGMTANALASSIVLVCRPRPKDAPSATRREFLNALKAELPVALHHLQRGNIAPVDLAQAAIGPGMAVFTRYSKVLDAEGEPIPVREALARINEVLDETLAAQEGDFDPDTRWAVTWFDQFGFDEGDYGQAEQLSKAKNTAVAELTDPRNGGIVTSRGGKVKLTRPADLPEDWNPDEDQRLTVWEMVHHLIARMDEDGEAGAAELVAQLGVRAESARELAYRLYAIAERKKRSTDGQPYNALVQSWPELVRLARDITASGATGPAQAELAI